MKTNLKKTADYAFEKFSKVREVAPVKPSAAMYMMVKIEIEEFKDIVDDIDFCKKLLEEECALVFPS
jgi:tyrosine aminotransferase